jgi:drug/metabolite transporter (DMT)-like permease
VLAMSTGAIFARLANAPAFAIAFWRCAIAALVFLPMAWPRLRPELLALSRRETFFMLLSGLCLALHFAAWISSLEYTTVAASALFVNTGPIWVGLLSPILMGEKPGRGMRFGIAAAFLGTCVVAWGDLGHGQEALLGDGLAVLGAILGSFYLLAGRRLRPQLSLACYALLVYGCAALGLLVLCLSTNTPLVGFEPSTWLWLALSALLPQVLGHTAANWALRWASAPLVAVSLCGEPLMSTLLALGVLGEAPPAQALLGAPLILLGIWLVARAEPA